MSIAMDPFYPADLSNGFSPLVFVVSVINDDDEIGPHQKPLFDRFMDSISFFQNESMAATKPINISGINNSTEASTSSNRDVSLFREDDDEENSSDGDDDELLLNVGDGRTRKKMGHGFNFGRRNTSLTSSDTTANPFRNQHNMLSATLSKTLVSDKSLFMSVRIVNISTRYGFPPSKDPEGTKNLAFELQSISKHQPRRNTIGSSGIKEKEQLLKNLFAEFPINGIIPTGWLEKHVHALPSTILVVCTVSSSQKDQAAQDQSLFSVIGHLLFSVVPKRQCSIQVVGLMKDDVTNEQGVEWGKAISQDLLLEENVTTSFTVTLLRISADLREDRNVDQQSMEICGTVALQKLYGTVREASLRYYRQQARRTKDKLSRLIDDKRKSGPPVIQLSPLIIRYCFKIAIFYAFQLNHEKSFRFFYEGYKSVVRYYMWLADFVNGTVTTDSSSTDTTPNIEGSIQSAPTAAESTESLEVELLNDLNEQGIRELLSTVIPAPSDNIIYQSRVVADWLNYKLITLSLVSGTDAGVISASIQWRQHSRIFSTCRFFNKTQCEDDWLKWSYICRQRIVFCRLLEKFPPKMVGGLKIELDEVNARCCPWRAYLSASEAVMCLAIELEKKRHRETYCQSTISSQQNKESAKGRARFVGGESFDFKNVEYENECNNDHRQKALDLILRSIALFDNEAIGDKRGFFAEDESSERASSRSGARLFYVAGGLLVGKKRYKEAAWHLTKASRYCHGWRKLELAVRRLLIECYEHYIPSESDSVNESRENIASMILDSYFNAELSSQNLRKALDHFSMISGGKTLFWYHETCDEDDASLPFSFAVGFPGKTHSILGATVPANVVIKSNLEYAVYVNSVALGTLAGKLVIPSKDLVGATNASEGSGGGIIIQANTSITISTVVDLPKDVSAIAFDESGNGGELLGVSGKGSFAKNAKPRTAGITSAGGARLVSEELLQRGGSNSQGWNVRFLGGKPLLCDGLHISFYPVQAEVKAASSITRIELSIQKKKKKTAANIKRTPFEEENYIASAWSRPHHLPLSRGPRSIRVLGPQPELVVRNVTDEATNSKALEGTVNRIFLELKSGLDECCSEIHVSVSCFSVLVTPTGTTKRLVSKNELAVENSIDMTRSAYRTPVLVNHSLTNKTGISFATPVGYDLPVGWGLAGTGLSDSKLASDIKGGEVHIFPIDFFRPAAYSQNVPLSSDGYINDDELGDVSLCRTDFYVSITYKQERLALEKLNQKRSKRGSRVRPVLASMAKVTTDVSDSPLITSSNTLSAPDFVSLDWSGSMIWTASLTAMFSPGVQKGYPSGNRHMSIRLENAEQYVNNENQLILTHGETLSVRCALQLDKSMDGVQCEIVSVRFENDTQNYNPISACLITNHVADDKDMIYRPNQNDLCRILSKGSKLCVGYTIMATLSDSTTNCASSNLGCLLVDWKPFALKFQGKPHGPLVLDSASTIRFAGPMCYLERTPFKVESLEIPPPISTATPFDIKYSITNTTSMHQSITIQVLQENVPDKKRASLLLSGYLVGALSLSPLETQTLSFRAVAIRSGEIKIPSLRVSSDRFKTILVDNISSCKCIYVFP